MTVRAGNYKHVVYAIESLRTLCFETSLSTPTAHRYCYYPSLGQSDQSWVKSGSERCKFTLAR